MRWWRAVGLAGVLGVAATGVLVARAERQRRAYTPEQVRARLHERYLRSLAAAPAGPPSSRTPAAAAAPAPPPPAGPRPPSLTVVDGRER